MTINNAESRSGGQPCTNPAHLTQAGERRTATTLGDISAAMSVASNLQKCRREQREASRAGRKFLRDQIPRVPLFGAMPIGGRGYTWKALVADTASAALSMPSTVPSAPPSAAAVQPSIRRWRSTVRFPLMSATRSTSSCTSRRFTPLRADTAPAVYNSCPGSLDARALVRAPAR